MRGLGEAAGVCGDGGALSDLNGSVDVNRAWESREVWWECCPDGRRGGRDERKSRSYPETGSEEVLLHTSPKPTSGQRR